MNERQRIRLNKQRLKAFFWRATTVTVLVFATAIIGWLWWQNDRLADAYGEMYWKYHRAVKTYTNQIKQYNESITERDGRIESLKLENNHLMDVIEKYDELTTIYIDLNTLEIKNDPIDETEEQ